MTAEIYMFKEFSDIWDWDKGKDKPKANKLFRFISYLCDIASSDNPLKDVEASKREVEAKFYVYKDKNHKFSKKEQALLEAGIEKFIYINTTPEERLLNAFDLMSENISKLVARTKPETHTNYNQFGAPDYVSNSKLLADTLKEMTSIRKRRSVLMASIKNEAMSERVRGQIKLSPLDKGLLTIE